MMTKTSTLFFLLGYIPIVTSSGKSWLHNNKASPSHFKYEPEGAFVRANSCISELFDIQQAEEQLSIKDILLSKPRTYILCPNTVFEIAESFDKNRRPRNGKQSPLIVGRSHIHIKCGDDGSSENQCIFRGGHMQVHMSPLFLTSNGNGTPNNKDDRPIVNALLQGITFSESQSFNILAEYPGEMTLLDCVFRDNKAVSLIFAHILAKDRTEESIRRRYASTEPHALKVHIAECIFEDNTIWSYSGISVDGLISAQDGASLEITRSIFLNNIMDSAMNLGYLVGISGGTLRLVENCFVGNNDHIVPVAVDRADWQATSNFVQRASSTSTATSCDFLSVVAEGSMYTTGDVELETDYTCFESDGTFCPAGNVLEKVETRISCMNSLAFVKEIESRVVDYGWTRTYLLCPNTEYRIDDYQGMMLPQSNVRVYCGIHGLPENNCTWSGGTTQLVIGMTNANPLLQPTVTNVTLSGITFTGASLFNIHVRDWTHVFVENCVFRENRNRANIFVGTDSIGKDNRLSDTPPADGVVEEPKSPLLSIFNSTFHNNTVGSIRGHDGGLVIGHNAELRIVSCDFRNTSNRAILNDVGFVIGNFGGSLEMIDNCLMENQVSASAVLSHSGDHHTFVNNYGRNSNSQHSYPCDLAVLMNVTDSVPAACAQFNGTMCGYLDGQEEEEDVNDDLFRDNVPFWQIPVNRSGATLPSVTTLAVVALTSATLIWGPF